jgi:membrane-bound ClpP family serine protease
VDTKETKVKRTVGDWLKVLILLLDEAAVIVLAIVVMRFFGVQIPLPIMIFGIILLAVLVFIVHRAVIPSFHLRPVSGSEALLGATGRVVGALTPSGTVLINGERWKAKSIDGNIEVDEIVEVVGREGLTLQVKRKE